MEIDVNDTEKPKAHKNVYVALAAAQTEMEPVVKGSVNPAFKSKYADLADVVMVVRPALNANGMTFWHEMHSTEADRFVRTIICHGESETRVECDVPLIVDKNNMQGVKSAVTYAKRIGLESVTGIAPEDDDGNAAAKAPPVMEERKGPTAAETARDSLSKADTLERLQAIWTDLPANVKAVPEVLTAKDMAKARLAAVKPNEDLGGDSLPY